MTRDELLELIATAEKATKGPWVLSPETGHYKLAVDSIKYARIIAAWHAPADEQEKANAAHLAKCDPDTIIELARLALSAMDAGELVGKLKALRRYRCIDGSQSFAHSTPEMRSVESLKAAAHPQYISYLLNYEYIRADELAAVIQNREAK